MNLGRASPVCSGSIKGPSRRRLLHTLQADPSSAFATSVHRELKPEMAANILVLASPSSPELSVLEQLPKGSRVVGVGRSKAELLKSDVSDAQLADVTILVICGVGANAAKKADVQVRCSKN